MKVRFIGDGATEVCDVFGQSFRVGEWVETDQTKLAANPMFEVKPTRAKAADAEPEQPPEQ